VEASITGEAVAIADQRCRAIARFPEPGHAGDIDVCTEELITPPGLSANDFDI
jgi:hypothetical protein